MDGATNLEHDEELLRAGASAVRTAFQRGTAVSLGIAQSMDGRVARAARELGIPVVRRRSGGSGLLHRDGDIYWSLVVPRAPRGGGLEHLHAYDRLGSAVSSYLTEIGIDAAWTNPFDLSNQYCLLGPRGRVLTTAGRAIGGAAQHLTATALLHQGVVNLELDRNLLARIFAVPREVLDASVTAVREHDIRLAPEALALGLLESLEQRFPRQ